MSEIVAHGSLRKGWRLARFTGFLKGIERKIMVDDSAYYDCVGVRWYGLGAFVRERLLGGNITRRQQWVIRTGDVVYNKLFAWKGAFAIADDSVDGCIVSDKFPLYSLDPTVMDPKYLALYFRTSQLAQQAQILSKGAAAISKLTLNPPQFWDLIIPLPPLNEQRRIAARVSEQMALVEEMRQAARAQVEAAKALPAAFLRQVFESMQSGQYPKVRLGDVCDFLPAKSLRTGGNTKVLAVTTACLSEVGFLPTGLKEAYMDGVDANWARLYPVEVLIARSNTPELVGRVAHYTGHPKGIVASDLTIRLWPKDSGIRGAFLAAYLAALYVVGYWREKAGGTSGTMKKITRTHLAALTVPVPGITEQQRIIVQLQERIAHVKEVRQAVEAQLEAISAFPGVLLEEVFGGF
ncbi:MAG TPA: restriction endonuclease subunit S, partial [Dehalococcoidia bacterium]|nr:restriction endonuclease subunit S [Dehalococcoidia bacterium]